MHHYHDSHPYILIDHMPYPQILQYMYMYHFDTYHGDHNLVRTLDSYKQLLSIL